MAAGSGSRLNMGHYSGQNMKCYVIGMGITKLFSAVFVVISVEYMPSADTSRCRECTGAKIGRRQSRESLFSNV